MVAEEQFIAVYPDGWKGNWNDGRNAPSIASHREGVDDVKFVLTIVEYLASRYDIDRSRIFATGVSNGGIFCHYLADKASDLFAGIAPIIGGMAEPVAKTFNPSHPISWNFFKSCLSRRHPNPTSSDPTSWTLETGRSGAEGAVQRKPNIVLILADNLGYAELGCQGCKDIPTPSIDSIARNGVRFTQGYVTCPICAPTRAGLLTGRYQQQFGFETNPGPEEYADENFGLPLDQPTLVEKVGGHCFPEIDGLASAIFCGDWVCRNLRALVSADRWRLWATFEGRFANTYRWDGIPCPYASLKLA